MNDWANQLRLSISSRDGIDSGSPSTRAPARHTRFLLDSLSLIFPNKMVNSVLKANRERFGSLLQAIRKFQKMFNQWRNERRIPGGCTNRNQRETLIKHGRNFFLGGRGGRVFLGRRSGGAPSGSPNLLHYFREYLCLDLQKNTSDFFATLSFKACSVLDVFSTKKKTNKLQRTKKKFHNAVYVITNLSVNLARVCVYIHRIKTSLKLSLALFISAIFKGW